MELHNGMHNKAFDALDDALKALRRAVKENDKNSSRAMSDIQDEGLKKQMQDIRRRINKAARKNDTKELSSLQAEIAQILSGLNR